MADTAEVNKDKHQLVTYHDPVVNFAEMGALCAAAYGVVPVRGGSSADRGGAPWSAGRHGRHGGRWRCQESRENRGQGRHL